MEAPEATVSVASARQPTQVMLLSGFVLYGLWATAQYSAVASGALRNFPEPWGRVFLLLMILACSLVLWAAWTDQPRDIVRAERAGHMLILTIFTIYALWSIVLVGTFGAACWISVLMLAGASLWRLRQIKAFRVLLTQRPTE